MDNPRHRHTLRALRPHGADQLDPDAQNALADARSDPALGAWFEREQSFDRAFAERIQTARAPADLRASIFAAVERAASTRVRATPRLVMHRPVATIFAALAAAASLALVAVLVWPKQTRSVAIQDVIAAAIATSPADLDARTMAGQSLADVRDWFAAQSAPVPGEVPAALAVLKTDGAGLVVLSGVSSSVVTFDAPAFMRDPSSGSPDRRLALFTLPRQSCSTAGISRQPTVREQSGHTLAVWRDATSVYVLTVDAPAEDLRRFLDGAGPAVTLVNSGWRTAEPERQPG